MRSAALNFLQRFPLSGNEITVGGVPLSLLAARAGRTPFYAYDRSLLDQRVREVRSALPAEIGLHYAMKANPMPALVCHMARSVDGLDVASGAELRMALDAGMNPREISFAGPGKSEVELAQAVATGILINIESAREVLLLEHVVQRVGRNARVAVRINPDFELKSSGMKMGGGPKQFGIDAEQVPQVLAAIGERGLGFEGFHIFSGSQNLRAEAICEAQSKAFALAVRLADRAPGPVTTLNLGGSFGIPYFPGDEPLDLSAIGSHLTHIVAQSKASLPQARLVVELGRFLVGEAGLYVCGHKPARSEHLSAPLRRKELR